MFEEEISKEINYYQRIRKPPIYLRNALSYFEIIQCFDNLVEVYMMIISKKVKEFFN